MSLSSRLEFHPRADLRILILSWRCPSNPQAGGAEAFTFQVARRLVAKGNTVEWFAASFPGARVEETIEGVRFVRAGRQWTVHWRAFMRYRRTLKDRFDVVIDEVNTMPFFTPVWARIPKVMLIFQLAREVWWYESPIPIRALGYAIEPIYLRTYRRCSAITISKSTEQDLRKLGFSGPITVAPIGIENVQIRQHPKASTPTFLYVGRLAPSKRIDQMMHALFYFKQTTGIGQLWLAGSGSERYVGSLIALARHLNLQDNVTFWGRISDNEKHRLMSVAHALLMTSVREGWGLVVTEANACGTPAVVYNVPGLRDSVRSEETGLIVTARPRDMSAALLRLTSDPGLYDRLAGEGQRWSQRFSFDKTAETIGHVLVQTRSEGTTIEHN
jgi:glycosyltransferase involved in cell wall biosynthesis